MTTVWILGDQLSPNNPALEQADSDDSIVLMIESKARVNWLRYHKKKLVLVYSAMRHFAADLRSSGWKVDYHELQNTKDFTVALKGHLQHWRPDTILLTEPNDWPMTQALKQLRKEVAAPIQLLPNNRFIVSREEFRDWAGHFVNYLKAYRSLPVWFCTAETEMNCLHQVLRQVIDLGYNHHIQRLMVLGNFLLLTGIHPREVDRWYLEMYVDAFDWVMAANVYGMILFADGGFMSTKPYAASGAYINKMSDYCLGCRFKPSMKTGPQACPFNYLYWNFFDQHGEKLKTNPHIQAILTTWDKKSSEEKQGVLRSAKAFLEALD